MMHALLMAICDDDPLKVRGLLAADRSLVTHRIDKARLFDLKIVHWLYAGDTVLHLAAAGHRGQIVALLLSAGADANAAGNHRKGRPLHYAGDGFINGPAWNATAQVSTIQCLLGGGAEINAQDKNGATALHRAVRTRCCAAVKCLLDAGSDPAMKNKPGSTPFHLALQDTGRGGSGAEIARTAQRQIIHEFLSRGVSTKLTNRMGDTVVDCARSNWIKKMLSGSASN